jgi:hypothetical protein
MITTAERRLDWRFGGMKEAVDFPAFMMGH